MADRRRHSVDLYGQALKMEGKLKRVEDLLEKILRVDGTYHKDLDGVPVRVAEGRVSLIAREALKELRGINVI